MSPDPDDDGDVDDESEPEPQPDQYGGMTAEKAEPFIRKQIG